MKTRDRFLEVRLPGGAFTLAETLFSMLVLSVAVITVMGVLAAGAKRADNERDRSLAAQIAVAAIEAELLRPVPVTVIRPSLEYDMADGAQNLVFEQVPPAISGRFSSVSGDLEAIVAGGAPLFFCRHRLAAAATTGVHRSQTRMICGVLTPDSRSATGALPPSWHPAQSARTLVVWSADWYQYQDVESGGDHNRNASTEYGILSDQARINAVEIARFNYYDPRQRLSLEAP